MCVRVCAVVLFLAVSAAAQFDAGSVVRRVRVRVVFSDGGCEASQISLIGGGHPILQASIRDGCEAEFIDVPVGNYQVMISGQGIAPVTDFISASNGSTDFEIKVKGHDQGRAQGGSGSAMVSATTLIVPQKARKELDKANELMAHQDFKKAIEELNKALAMCPNYASAYNNLGAVYAQLGDRGREREALQKAIGIDEHFAPAYVNLGRMDFAAKNFDAAESDLGKANSYDPTDAMTLVLLAYSQFMNHHFDAAIATAARAHGLAGAHAFAHQVAARAFEQKRDGPGAIAELELFLKEEPTGPRAEIAHKELATLHNIVRTLEARGQ